jgi:mono/diheme cytochrome c family protein
MWGTERIAKTILVLSATITITSSARSEDLLARGAELVRHVAACGQCHTPLTHDGTPIASLEFAGGEAKEVPLGTISPPNITPDKETGIGSWSEQDIVNALRNGTRPDGTIIGPPMPIAYYRKLSDGDALAIAKYLKSIPPIRRIVRRSVYKGPLPTTYGPPINGLPAPSRNDKIAYGAYLTGLAHCLLCHTPVANGRPDLSRLGGGGRQYVDDHGNIILSANLTPDKMDGIGGWSDQDLKKAITQGINPYGAQLNSFMPSAFFSGMAPDDLDAIVTYLRSLKPIASN